MKTIRFLFTLTLLCTTMVAGAQSQELSSNAQKFKTNLLSFLREEGYVPTIDNNGKTVNFKREGENYWIDLSGSMPVQVTMHISGFANKDANVLAILLACNDVNRDKYYVKAYVDNFGDDGSTNIAIEMPCHTAEEFRYVFNDCVKSLASARNDIQEAYNKNQLELDNSNKPFSINSCSVANQDKNCNIITNYGNTIYSYTTKYLIPKVNITCEKAGNYTIYYKLYLPNGTLSTGTNSPSGYSTSKSLYIYSGTRDYELIGWGADNAGNWKSGTYKYEFYCNDVYLGFYNFTIK